MAEAEYINGLADYICTMLPEDPRRQKRVLLAIKQRMRPRMPRWMLGASMGFLAAVGAIVAAGYVDASMDATPHARIAHLPDGRKALKIITEAGDGTIVVLWMTHIDDRKAKQILADPDWRRRTVERHLKQKRALAPVSVVPGS